MWRLSDELLPHLGSTFDLWIKRNSRSGCIDGVHEPNIASGVPETQPKRASVAKDVEVCIILALTI